MAPQSPLCTFHTHRPASDSPPPVFIPGLGTPGTPEVRDPVTELVQRVWSTRTLRRTRGTGQQSPGASQPPGHDPWAPEPTLACSCVHHAHVCLSSVQSLSRVRLFGTPWTAARQASLSITNSWSLPRLISIESVMPSNHLILCHPLLLLPSIFLSIRVFSTESALRIRWPKDWSFSFSISSSSEYAGLISFRMGWFH